MEIRSSHTPSPAIARGPRKLKFAREARPLPLQASDATDEGTARAVQQGGDQPEVVEEAISSCPADCIHRCSRAELEVLEEHRDLYLADMLSQFHGCASFSGGAGGSQAAPHWRDPLVHTSWMKGAKYVRTERAKLSDPLLHHSGDATEFSIIGTHKVNEDKE